MDSSTQTRGPANLTKEDWVQYYWFSPLQMIEVINPAWAREGDGFVTKDYPFMVEMRHFMIPAGKTERLPGTIANVYLDGISKILAQNDDQLGFMADPNLKRLYYDALIVNVESLIQEVNAGPSYLAHVPPSIVVKEEKAPWDDSMGERASDVAPTPSVAPPAFTPPVMNTQPSTKKSAAGTKEFEYNSLKFKAVTDEAGETTFFKNDIEIDEPTYAKAASML